jgi:predicted phosphohydrolase
MRARSIKDQKNKNISYFTPLRGYKDLYCLVRINRFNSNYCTYRIIKSANHFLVIAYDSDSNLLSHFSEHVFMRYCERLKLANLSHQDQLKHFLKHFNDYRPEYEGSDEEGMKLFEQKMYNGVVYGATDAVNGICYYRTFYTYRMVNSK